MWSIVKSPFAFKMYLNTKLSQEVQSSPVFSLYKTDDVAVSGKKALSSSSGVPGEYSRIHFLSNSIL